MTVNSFLALHSSIQNYAYTCVSVCVFFIFYLRFWSSILSSLLLISNWWLYNFNSCKVFFFVLFFSLLRRQTIWNRTDKDKKMGCSNKHSDSIHNFFLFINIQTAKANVSSSNIRLYQLSVLLSCSLSPYTLMWQQKQSTFSQKN